MMKCYTQQKRGVILHPGAIGDCLLTLPLAASIKKTYGLDRLDFFGKTEYLDFYPGRTCIDGIRSLDSIQLHRLFCNTSEFFLDDQDRLADVFAEYEQVVSFLGAGHPDFESNLLFTIHSTHTADVTVLDAAPTPDYDDHVTDYYHQCFAYKNQLPDMPRQADPMVTPLPSDYASGADILQQMGINPDAPLVLIHPGSGSKDKCWHLENIVQVANTLKKQSIQPVFLLGPAEHERLPKEGLLILRARHPVLENLSLTQVLQVLTQADVFFGNDSGIGHLSAAMGKKTLVVFGPTNDTHYRPLGPAVILLRPEVQSFTQANPIQQQEVICAILQML